MEKKLLSISLTVEVANNILQYLATRPYQEVVELINLIQKSEPTFESDIKE